MCSSRLLQLIFVFILRTMYNLANALDISNYNYTIINVHSYVTIYNVFVFRVKTNIFSFLCFSSNMLRHRSYLLQTMLSLILHQIFLTKVFLMLLCISYIFTKKKCKMRYTKCHSTEEKEDRK